MRFLAVAARIAWRELKATPSRFVFVILAVAVGVGALSGVKGFGSAFSSMLFRNAKQLTASDLTAQVWGLPDDDQLNRLRAIGKKGGALTWVTETVSMAARPGTKTPQMVAVKAVDPAVYPFYGQLTLAPPQSLAELLTDNNILANEELLIRLHLKRGDVLRLGGQDFRITGTLVTEPDRLASGFGPSMRVMMSRDSLRRTGLIQVGSRAAQRFLFRLGPDADVEKLKTEISAVLPRPRYTDFRNGDPAVERGINRSTTFLSLVSLIALIVGSLGVGMAMYSHLQQKMDTIAVMKAVGARSRQIVTIYLIQTLWLGLAGGLMGVALGAFVQKMFPVLIHQVFDLLPEVAWDWSFSLQGLAVGVLATLLFTLPPIVGVWHVRPSIVFRREMDDANRKPAWQSPAYLVCLAAIAAGFIAISLWLSGSWKVSGYFVGGLAASLVLLGIAASLLLRSARWIVRRSGRKLPASFRHGFANLYRPGTHAASILVALGVGVVFTTTTYLIQKTIIRDVETGAPARAGNVYLLDIRPGQRDEVARFIAAQPGVEKPPDLVGYFVARMLRKNDTPVQNLSLTKQRKDQLQTSRLNVVEEAPKNFDLVSGRFWDPQSREPQIAISEEESQRFGFNLGDRLQFQAAGKLITAPIVAVYRPNKRAAFRFEILFPREAMGSVPAVYFGSAQVRPADIPALEGAIFEKFPTITIMNLADILQRIQQAIDQVALVIRFLAGFAIVAGIVILCSSVAGTRYRRMREVAILKTLGATRRRITTIFSVEFTILGTVAGLIGGLLANAFTRVIATKYIEVPFHFDAVSVVVAVVAMALLANAAGWIASLKILDLRPLEVLRAE
jgi:putative ABC transport system permease protein